MKTTEVDTISRQQASDLRFYPKICRQFIEAKRPENDRETTVLYTISRQTPKTRFQNDRKLHNQSAARCFYKAYIEIKTSTERPTMPENDTHWEPIINEEEGYYVHYVKFQHCVVCNTYLGVNHPSEFCSEHRPKN